mmetsp:Transcript_997/g.4050  ORF Transcript_997/g.4050 Transcript_997/m.4050 type:complete len:217 (+) Transcript_997:70-720(+)
MRRHFGASSMPRCSGYYRCLCSVGLRHARAERGDLEEGSLLHDAEEFLLVDLAVAVAVSLVDHLLKLLVGHVLAELLRHALEVLEADLAGLIVVEEAESLHDLLAGVALAHLGGHHGEELLEVDGAGAILVDVGDHLLDLLLLGLEAEGAHGNLELLGVDGAGAVGVEEVERLADLLLLLLGETGGAALALVAASGTNSHCKGGVLSWWVLRAETR